MQTSVALFRLKTRKLLPLYLQRTGNVEEWLRMRAIDAHRTNSRLLKRALRLRHRDDVSTVLHFNGATITDTYWVKLQGSDLCYEDIRFKHNYFDGLALRGDADSFNQAPGRTPELTNIGSFEKCWRRLNGVWWLYTAGNAAERFTEVFSSTLAAVMHMDAEKYELDGTYVRSRDFTDGASCNFETAVGIIGDQSEYADIFATLHAIDSRLAESFTYMVFFDAILFNMDRREHNWGVLRDVHTGTILRLAPLFDILRSLPADIRGMCHRRHDRLLEDFIALVTRRKPGSLPELSLSQTESAVQRSAIRLERPEDLPMDPRVHVSQFVHNGYLRVAERLKARKED